MFVNGINTIENVFWYSSNKSNKCNQSNKREQKKGGKLKDVLAMFEDNRKIFQYVVLFAFTTIAS